jgi:nicotinamidase-related amidase
MKSKKGRTALLLVDVQKGFAAEKWGRRNNPGAELRMSEILLAWRRSKRPVIYVRHDSVNPESPLRPQQPGNEIMEIVVPLSGEPIFAKSVNSAFIGTKLEEHLRAEEVENLVIVGLTTPHCISTTARMAGNLGFGVRVVADATAAFELRAHDGTVIPAEEAHFHALAALSGEFAQIVTAQHLL